MRIARLLPAAALAAALAACQGPNDAGKPALALTDCRLQGLENAARCGTLEVWEDRGAQSGRKINIKVAVVPARSEERRVGKECRL